MTTKRSLHKVTKVSRDQRNKNQISKKKGELYKERRKLTRARKKGASDDVIKMLEIKVSSMETAIKNLGGNI